MATISFNNNAPEDISGDVVFSFSNAEPFTLAKGASFESDDPQLLADAQTHPWLQVEYPDNSQHEQQEEKAAATEVGVTHDDPFPTAEVHNE